MNDMSEIKDLKKNDDRMLKYKLLGHKACKGICDRDVILSSSGSVIVCNSCKRIVIDNRV